MKKQATTLKVLFRGMKAEKPSDDRIVGIARTSSMNLATQEQATGTDNPLANTAAAGGSNIDDIPPPKR
jgi:hypothetical protein